LLLKIVSQDPKNPVALNDLLGVIHWQHGDKEQST